MKKEEKLISLDKYCIEKEKKARFDFVTFQISIMFIFLILSFMSLVTYYIGLIIIFGLDVSNVENQYIIFFLIIFLFYLAIFLILINKYYINNIKINDELRKKYVIDYEEHLKYLKKQKIKEKRESKKKELEKIKQEKLKEELLKKYYNKK